MTIETWLAGLPAHVQEVAKRFPPDQLYKIKETKHIGQLHSYDEEEDGSVTFQVMLRFDHNPGLLFERIVFGLTESELEVYGPLR